MAKDVFVWAKDTNSKIDEELYCKVKCQQCGKYVIVLKNHPYFGILCSKCMTVKGYNKNE